MTTTPVLHDADAALHGRGFWLLAAAFPILMAYSTVPTPIYPLYQRHDHFPTVMITAIFAAYGLGVMASLYLAGHLSDQFGRRRMIAIATAVSLVSAAIFIGSPSVPALLVARLLCGVGIGVLTPAATAMLGELRRVHRPHEPSSFASTVASSVNTGGLALGPLVGGVLVQWAPAPLRTPYVVFFVLLAVVGLALTLVPETNPATPANERPRYRPQRAVVRPGHEARFRSAQVVAGAAFAALGILTSMTGTFLAHVAHRSSPLVCGVVVFLAMGASALAQVALPIPNPRTKIACGVLFAVAGLGCVAASALTHPFVLYAGGAVMAGAGIGLLFQSAVAVGSAVSEAGHTGGSVAGVFLAAYIGITIPVVLAGLLTTRLSISASLALFCALTSLVVLVASIPMMRGASD